MPGTENAADSALSGVLAEIPDHHTLDLTDAATTDGDEVDSAPRCTAEEAQQLVDEAKRGLELFDTSMQSIIRLRAWEPLGYDSPREFVLGEFGPNGDDPDNPARVSKVHAYRLARLAAFTYGLVQRLGDEALAVELSERTLRSLPAGRDGENDLDLLDRMEARVGETGEVFDVETAQQVLDEEITRAQQELTTDTAAGEAAKPSTGERDSNDRGPDPADALANDSDDSTEPGTGLGGNDGPSVDADDTSEPPQQSGAAIEDLAATYGTSQNVSEQAETHTQQLAEVSRALRQLAQVGENVGEVLSYADDDEVADLKQLAETTRNVCEALTEAADERALSTFA